MSEVSLQSNIVPSGRSGLVGEKPLMPDVGVIALVPDFWNSPYMPRHQVLARLAKYFHVVWVEPAQGWRELWLEPESHHNAEKFGTEELPPGFEIYRPGKWLPKMYRPQVLANYLEKKRLTKAREILKRRGCRTFVLYLWRPEFLFALQAVPHDMSCYHIDDEYSFSEVEQPSDPQELAVIERVDQVIVHSPALMEKKGEINPQTVQIPNGVDYEIFAHPVPEPEDIKDIPHPRIGYVGVIKRQLDIDLLLELACRHREWSFVMVGPMGFLGDDVQKIEELRRRPNVYFLGNKNIHDLPGYPQSIDVCLMCYRINDYTKYIYPLKLHEYLAGGRPVVASPIRSLLGFAKTIRFASTSDEWSRAIEESLSPSERSEENVEKRRRIAREHDWFSLVDRIAEVMCRRLGQDYCERFSSVSEN